MALQAYELEQYVDPTGRCSRFEAVVTLVEHFGLTLARDDEMAPAQRLAASQVASTSVSASSFSAMQALTGCSIFVGKELGEITGVLAFVPLNQRGVDALERGAFDATEVPAEFVARNGESPAGGYAWGFAGSTTKARKAVVKASLALAETLWWAIPGYGRIATDDGARVVLGKMGYELIPGDTTGMCKRPAHSAPLQGLQALKDLAA